MTGFDIRYAAILLISVFLSSVSQVLLKKAAGEKHESFIAEYLNKKVIFAYAIFFLSTLLTVFSYKGIPLSMGPLLEATSYIYVTIFGIKIFNEKMDKKKTASLFLIIGGIVFYSLFG